LQSISAKFISKKHSFSFIYLNEIANICGINKKMTTHTTRHTFATTTTIHNQIFFEKLNMDDC